MKKITIIRLAVLACALLLCLSACGIKKRQPAEDAPVPTIWLITAEPSASAQETAAPEQQTLAPVMETPAPVQQTLAPLMETPAPTPEQAAPEQPEQPAPEGEEDPARFINISTSSSVRITKHPGGETVRPGDSTLFTAKADGISAYEWRFVSPDYKREVVWNAPELATEFPGLSCRGGATFKLELFSIPKELDGWYAVCLFTGTDGGLKATEGALIRVTDAARPAAAPAKPATPTPTSTPEVTNPPETPPTTEPTSTEPTPTTEPTTEPTPTPPETPAEPTPAPTPDSSGSGGEEGGQG